jgi:hypothetical protein
LSLGLLPDMSCVPDDIKEFLEEMLSKYGEDRPSLDTVIEEFEKLK